jgi:flagellar biosynthesis/type III secretory pathway chaperone
MFSKFMTFLKFEEQLLSELVRLAERQQKALVNYNVQELEEIASFQNELLKNIRNAEEQRVLLLATWLNLSKFHASKLTLSNVVKYCKRNEAREIEIMQSVFETLHNRLQTINLINKVLINRAKNGIREMLEFLTNGTQNVCNVRV